MPTDSEVLQNFIRGDENAFMELVSKFRDPITGYINAMIGDYDKAVDLAQETFLRVYKNAESYKNTYQFSTWIYRIATNLAIDEIRWRKRQGSIFFARPLSTSDRDHEGYGLNVPDARQTPDEELLRKEKRKVLSEAINALPKRYRFVFVLKEMQGLPYERIAEILDCSCGTVKSRLHRARESLRKKLKKYFNEATP